MFLLQNHQNHKIYVYFLVTKILAHKYSSHYSYSLNLFTDTILQKCTRHALFDPQPCGKYWIWNRGYKMK